MSTKNKSDCALWCDPPSQYLHEFKEHLQHLELARRTIETMTGNARHFLIWMMHANVSVESIDDTVLLQFRDHQCQCHRFHAKWQPGRNPSTRKVMAGVLRLVSCLEKNGHVSHLDGINHADSLLDRFVDHLRDRGCRTANKARTAGRHLLVWLHRRRIPVAELDASAVQRFFGHDCVCGETFRGISNSESSRHHVNRFIKFLTAQGIVTDSSLVQPERTKPQMPDFAQWLFRHRGIQQSTVDQHVRQVFSLLPLLGDPKQYSAVGIRDALLSRFQSCSVPLAWALAGSIRMYLRFLSAEGVCSAALVSSVPTARRWKKSSLPRYLQATEIEQLIATCDTANPAGLRDRAMFLLMARLGLRPGDVKALKFSDIDWTNAQIHVCGKSGRTVALPLPQDAGDAVLEYAEKARPNMDEPRIFLTAIEPYRPIDNVCTISTRVRKSLQRAGIEQTSNRGAGLFRHSAATALLREGAELSEIQTLLRHRSIESTAIYAKVDLPMLQAVAQPWLGGGK